MSVSRGAGRRIVVSAEANYDTAPVEALIAAAQIELDGLLHSAERMPKDSGLLAYTRDTLRVANETLQVRRLLRSGG